MNEVTEKDYIQPWGDMHNITPTEQYWYILPYVKNIIPEFKRNLQHAAEKSGVKNPKTVISLKTEDSYLNKAHDRQYPPEKMIDMLRSRVLVREKQDIGPVVRAIEKIFKVLRKKSYDLGDDRHFGYYGAAAVVVEVNGVAVEIQIMTKRLKAFGQEAHKIYQKYRANPDANPYKDYSKKLFKAANVDLPRPKKPKTQ